MMKFVELNGMVSGDILFNVNHIVYATPPSGPFNVGEICLSNGLTFKITKDQYDSIRKQVPDDEADLYTTVFQGHQQKPEGESTLSFGDYRLKQDGEARNQERQGGYLGRIRGSAESGSFAPKLEGGDEPQGPR